MEVKRIKLSFPLEFRCSDLSLGRYIEMVIGGILDREGRAIFTFNSSSSWS